MPDASSRDRGHRRVATILGSQRRYQQTARPFDWRFTGCDLDRLLRRLDDKEQLANAA